MIEKAVLPKEVEIQEQAIVILWDDGHRSPYPHRFLRLRCPCASCVDEMTGRPRLDPDTVPQDVSALDQMQVGNYALQFLWSDAHYTGIYPYKYLISHCTCIVCAEARAGAKDQAGESNT
ncbi:MAG TPA: DUF971 domain-containing protein [Dehalococcoidia bacterium]|jgi:ATP-binding protein involved in chromosome partitioning|uniref:Gamma-butyrobetaine hydroxylase-like N-terminal domain-containing protein n=1 Tax=uncultured marine microorganism HF4000_APKG10K24 TaxID=455562 RepID=B3TCG7_9ZZZZ|nr:putative protein of unknown function (DUF971) [uncultured marine microorganism HF4000_APKG10K24]HIN06641.1 DUF971 domain-containing protein [Dehalococcoidia bacterium]